MEEECERAGPKRHAKSTSECVSLCRMSCGETMEAWQASRRQAWRRQPWRRQPWRRQAWHAGPEADVAHLGWRRVEG